MDLQRIIRHWNMAPYRARQCFGRATMDEITQAIAASERGHRGELRFVVEGRLSLPQLLRGVTARQRAGQLFAKLGVGGTAEKSGIVIYVLLAERKVEIFADSGIAARVAQAEWDALCDRMTRAFAAGQFREGALEGIDGATRLLATHFPAHPDNPNELPDTPVML